MKLTNSVTASIRHDKKKIDGTCPIYFFVRVGSHLTKIPSGKSINPNDWDSKKRRPKTTTKVGSMLNKQLTKVINGFDEYTLTQEAMGRTITTTIATAYFKGNTEKSLFQYWEDQLKLWHDKEYNTIKSYRSTLNIVKEFNPKLNFGDLSPLLVEQFDKYLAEVRGNSIGGRFTKHKCFKSILNDAIKKGYLKENPYRFFKIKSAEGKRMFLTLEEVVQIMQYNIPDGKPHLKKIKDMFLFSCFTGLRYSDVISLKTDSIKLDNNKPRLDLVVKKTDRNLVVPLNSNALAIISNYILPGVIKQETKIFPTITNQALNRELKDLIGLIGISKFITFHCARHTFACNLLEMDTSLMHIRDMMGHRDLKHTQIYAKTLNSKLFDSINTLDNYFTSQSK